MNGEIKTIVKYLDNIIEDGTYSRFDQEGRKEMALVYMKGILVSTITYSQDSIKTIYDYYKSGIKSAQGRWVNGMKNGTWKEWNKDGILLFEGVFVNDKKMVFVPSTIQKGK
jgi:antitoxin component YwqK of YwqJK toxin-antitoxin module